jgi:hypothetical protein
MEPTYHQGSRRLQDRFDTRRLADRLDDKFVQHPVIEPDDKEFIERLDMFFLATADAEGCRAGSTRTGRATCCRHGDPARED